MPSHSLCPARPARPTFLRSFGLGFAVLAALWTSPIAAVGAADLARLQHRAVQNGPRVEAALRELLALLRRSSAGDVLGQLQAVNQYFNQKIAFAEDTVAWGQTDYWASPLEALSKGQGDCEDYALAKYFSLLAAGVPVARLRLVYVRAVLGDGRVQAHMVLAYYPSGGGDTLILDNLIDQVEPARMRDDLTPVFSFNSDGLWQGVGTVGAGSPAARLTRWREVMAKARAEGFF